MPAALLFIHIFLTVSLKDRLWVPEAVLISVLKKSVEELVLSFSSYDLF